MITLQDFRDQTRHLPPGSKLGISFDEESGTNVIAIRTPDSQGGETVIDCGELPALEEDDES
jgi:hypothetical protein